MSMLRLSRFSRLSVGRDLGAVAQAAALTVVLALGVAGQPARAALFEDDEARKAILDLRSKQAQSEEAQRARIADLQSQLETARRGLLDLSGQIDSLRSELAKMRGQNEQLARDLSDTQRKVADQSATLDNRLRPLEPQKVSLDGKEFQADPEEKRQFDAAMGQIRRGDFNEAVSAFSSFLTRFPASGYGDSVRFWLGNAQYGKRDYKGAIATFKAFVAANPDHPRAAESLLAIANCQIELKDNKSARKTLDDLQKAYPGSEAAKAAKERQAGLR
ncbi:tol-pal system protein YbgF [Roseateles chitosanitabidus]|jgi:tol-pal system protein YbgF|uniref:tol-pal system protein YbgF n=1 Tax=Roseateles chitosanitabidus TaxID=65048 RepID=UPI000A7D15EF|nr:tol-pal system protein YbgF [Roseateles chitosanitabidus]